MQTIWPDVPRGNLTSDSEWTAAYAWPEELTGPWVRANAVMTLDGCIAGLDGKSASISTPADRRMLGVLRRDSDVILVGAGTVRAENYGPATRPLAIVTRSMDLPLDLRFFTTTTRDSPRSFVLTTGQAISAASQDLIDCLNVIDCGATEVNLMSGLKELADLGLKRIHCEGGPELLTHLVENGLLDELLLTISPQILGGSGHLIGAILDSTYGGKVRQVLELDGSVFLRVLFDRTARPTH